MSSRNTWKIVVEGINPWEVELMGLIVSSWAPDEMFSTSVQQVFLKRNPGDIGKLHSKIIWLCLGKAGQNVQNTKNTVPRSSTVLRHVFGNSIKSIEKMTGGRCCQGKERIHASGFPRTHQAYMMAPWWPSGKPLPDRAPKRQLGMFVWSMEKCVCVWKPELCVEGLCVCINKCTKWALGRNTTALLLQCQCHQLKKMSDIKLGREAAPKFASLLQGVIYFFHTNVTWMEKNSWTSIAIPSHL
jgi:hypothetical protein